MTQIRCIASALLIVLGCGLSASAQNAPIADAKGFQHGHSYFTKMPFESVNTANGALVLTFTDLELPGNAGRSLKFQRTFNSKDFYWTFGIAGLPLWVRDDPWPQPPISTGIAAYTGDGAEHMFGTGAYEYPNNYIESTRITFTDQFWRYDRSTRLLSMPDGSRNQYNADGKLLTHTDPFGNEVRFLWIAQNGTTPPRVQITQDLGDEERVITITMPGGPGLCILGVSGCRPVSMEVDGRTWTYTLTTAQPPQGAPWQFIGDTLITPFGGEIRYTFEDLPFPDASAPPGWRQFTRVLRTREVVDPRGESGGIWRYDYEFDGPSVANWSKETAPDGTATTHYYSYDIGTPQPSPGNNFAVGAYPARTYVMRRRTVEKAGVLLEEEDLVYKWQSIPSSRAADALPAIQSRTLTRGGRTYTTTYAYRATNYGDYHNPERVEESNNAPGASGRVITYEYASTPNGPYASPFIVGKTTLERTEVNGEAFEQRWQYDGGTLTKGFVTSHTEYGVTTTFAQHPTTQNGNVHTATKGNGAAQTVAYSWGVVSQIVTPAHTTTRVVDRFSLVRSESQGGRTTAFVYDESGRLKEMHPAGGTTPTIYTYDNTGGATVTTTRGPSVVTTTLDGFGRQVRTSDSVLVETLTKYDTWGRAKYKGEPFIGADPQVGVTIEYDGLGRVRKETHKGGAYREYTHGADTVTVRDENNRITTLTYRAFGSPEERLLVGVQDAKGGMWTYSYNALGKLSGVSGPQGVSRSWEYWLGTTLLKKETHPESGIVEYQDYDDAGNLTQKKDAKNVVWTYTYDGNDRVQTINAGGRITTFTYEDGSDKRRTTVVDGVTTELSYDAAGRLRSRTDVVDGHALQVDLEYDSRDNLEYVTYPSARRVKYTYDSGNRIQTITNDRTGAVYAQNFTYHATGNLTGYLTGNGLATTIGYDPNRYWVSSIGGVVQLGYQYDDVGNVRYITKSAVTDEFRYDELDRLDLAIMQTPGTIDFDYDANGNPASSNYVPQSGNPFRLQSAFGASIGYDSNGNMTSNGSSTFTFGTRNLMDAAQVGAVTAQFVYDADEWRLKKRVVTSTTTTSYFTRGGTGQLLMEWTRAGSIDTMKDYIYAGARLIASVLANGRPVGVAAP
jgi:YD repeat-containing protein